MTFAKILARLCDKKQPKPAQPAALIPMRAVAAQPKQVLISSSSMVRVRTHSVLSDLDSPRVTPLESYRSIDSTPATSPELMASPSLVASPDLVTSPSVTPVSPDLAGFDVYAARKELIEIRNHLDALYVNYDEMALFSTVYLTKRPAEARAIYLTGLAGVLEKYFADETMVISALRAGAERLEGHHQFEGSSLRSVLDAMRTIYPVMQEKVKFLAELIKINSQFRPIRDSAPQSPTRGMC